MLPLIAGNWKMNTDLRQGANLVLKLRDLLKGVEDVEVAVAPPYVSIHHLSHLLADSPIKLAGQDLFWEKDGAYTGEVSGEMLSSVGCKYVIIGHSERRQYFMETDETVNKKTFAALRVGLKPIVCIGESLDERERGKTLSRVKTQLSHALSGLAGAAMKEIVIAYEPVWAIGTGRTATPQQAEEVHNALRELLYELFESESVRDVRIIYGGSVKPDSIDELMAQPNIDGALVGGASLKAEDFARIVRFQRPH
ncbi:MAG: triose-phosphate isomerase [Deltaproteobacteria bacterium GWC2_55_46]|nr:MAG: triose-phosphate isomerase [Deltaproteobacteria bacterium GWA2_55_82]OGQ64831.1 MAG: triose-phosphate isomerase [Deltaproteobacteria bacterium RIFCSPLOWO2_02_FULL_55_12]OIJ73898.1 MAG: triose-phosphate isomerase [Deltaproteobacteria bacterium GWC2_55_46]